MQYNQFEEELSISSISDQSDSSDQSDQNDNNIELEIEVAPSPVPIHHNIQHNLLTPVKIFDTCYYINTNVYNKHINLFTNNVLIPIDIAIYNKFIIDTSITIDLLIIGTRNYANYTISYELIVCIEKYTYAHAYDWHSIVNQTDYNLDLFRRRQLPYFNLESKDWVKANIDAGNAADYPDIFTDSDEQYMVRNNNFLSWQLLPTSMYDIDMPISLIKCLYQIGLKRHSLMLFTQLLQSPLTCHICYSDIFVLFANDLTNAVIADILAYSLSYAMYILRQEETIMFSKVCDNYRVLLTHEQALMLPVFSMHIEQSPYIITLTDDTRLSSTMIFHLMGKRRLCTSDEFKNRFRLATGGAFNNIDLSSIGAAITGSILVPCVHISPLEEQFNNCQWDRSRSFPIRHDYMIDDFTNSDIPFLNYLEYYYPSYCSLTDEDYCKTMNVKPVADDDDLIYDEDLVEPTETEATTEPTENKSSKGIEYNQLADIDISITTNSIETFKERVYILYNKILENCQHRGHVYITCIKTISSIKYKIYGPGVPRPMDVFRISYSPAKMVKKFHLHVVKMYYVNTLTLFRSCVSCLLSGISESYKWFACKKIPADVLLKYAQRGFTTVLNQVERESIANYIVTNDRYSLMLQYLQIKPNEIYCCVNNKHAFFKPCLYSAGIRLTLRMFTLCDEPYNRLVISYNQSLKPYGVLQFADVKKIYPPNQMIVLSALNHINYY